MRNPNPPTNSAESSLKRLAAEKLTQLREKGRVNLAELDLFEFMVQASPHLRKPHHLESSLAYLESIEEKPISFVLSAPPRHGKTLMLNHLVARQMIRHPGLRVAYGCYNLDLSGFNSNEVKDIMLNNNIELDRNRNSKEEWQLANGSSFKCVAPGSGFTGRGGDLIIIDDPYKGRAEAESGLIRDRTWSWFTSVAITRKSPKASVIVSHTRWHSEDISGRIVAERNWPCINLPAYNLAKEALWPDEWGYPALREIEETVGPYEWASLYMGEPRPRGGAVFGDVHTYGGQIPSGNGETLLPNPSQLPEKFERITIGIDAAYTKRTHSDYSVAVVMGIDKANVCYILDVVRVQEDAPAFGKRLKDLRMVWGSPQIYWSIGGTEVAVVDFFRHSLGVPINAVTAKEDKFVRAQAVAAAWNAGKVRMPSDEPTWCKKFLSEVLSFTGLDDPHDDQVDALAAAYIPLAKKRQIVGNMSKQLLSF